LRQDQPEDILGLEIRCRESAEVVSVSGVERQSLQLLMPTFAARAANCSWIIAFQFQRRPVLPHNHGVNIAPAEGKLGVLIPGLGAVTTTFIAGIEAIRRGLGKPVGSVTQMGTVRLGKRTEARSPAIKDFVPLASMEDLEIGCWDIFDDNAYEAAVKAGVLEMPLLEKLKEPLTAIKPMKAVFDQKFVKRINGPNIMAAGSKMDRAQQVMEDIRQFQRRTGVSRMTMIWCGSTEVYHEAAPVHASLKDFECGLQKNDPEISPSQIYAYAALKMGVPYANGAPHLTTDMPALLELARNMNLPVCGKDYKSGQTFMKTLVAPGLKSRMLGVSGWFSTNILGNRDGEVLDDSGSFRSKEVSKSSALEYILQNELYPDLYKDIYHKVRIEYYPPRGDAKEGWDNIDIFGLLGYPMQIKINFLCRDSILAAPLVLDIVLFMDLAQRAGMRGVQEWLSFYFKAPMHAPEVYPEHDIFIQLMKLKNTLRWIRGEDLITHLGLEYYD
jgi:myo-inositol-1-phosphate synthase